jgi:hypothetical protein
MLQCNYLAKLAFGLGISWDILPCPHDVRMLHRIYHGSTGEVSKHKNCLTMSDFVSIIEHLHSHAISIYTMKFKFALISTTKHQLFDLIRVSSAKIG